jgi:hypothetical protein
VQAMLPVWLIPQAPPGPSARKTVPKPRATFPKGPPLELFNTRTVELAELSLKKIPALKSSDVAIRAASCPFAPSVHIPLSNPSSLFQQEKRVAEAAAVENETNLGSVPEDFSSQYPS